MEEIRIGDYVRDRDGFIIQVKNIVPDEDSEDIWYEEKILNGTWKSMIVKHSKNLIDLIEEGDYVNGEKVVGRGNNCILILTDEGQTFLRNIFEDNDIKSIVTKEQFKSVEYIVGGKE